MGSRFLRSLTSTLSLLRPPLLLLPPLVMLLPLLAMPLLLLLLAMPLPLLWYLLLAMLLLPQLTPTLPTPTLFKLRHYTLSLSVLHFGLNNHDTSRHKTRNMTRSFQVTT